MSPAQTDYRGGHTSRRHGDYSRSITPNQRRKRMSTSQWDVAGQASMFRSRRDDGREPTGTQSRRLLHCELLDKKNSGRLHTCPSARLIVASMDVAEVAGEVLGVSVN